MACARMSPSKGGCGKGSDVIGSAMRAGAMLDLLSTLPLPALPVVSMPVASALPPSSRATTGRAPLLVWSAGSGCGSGSRDVEAVTTGLLLDDRGRTMGRDRDFGGGDVRCNGCDWEADVNGSACDDDNDDDADADGDAGGTACVDNDIGTDVDAASPTPVVEL